MRKNRYFRDLKEGLEFAIMSRPATQALQTASPNSAVNPQKGKTDPDKDRATKVRITL